MQKGFSKIFLVLIIVVVVLGGLFYLGGNSDALSHKNWSVTASSVGLQPVKTADDVVLTVAKEGDESTIFLNFTVPDERSTRVYFDMKFIEKGDGDWVTGTFNDQLLFSFRGDHFFGENYQRMYLVGLGMFAGQTGVLKFTMYGYGTAPSSVSLKNFSLER